ncbi:unnamed protein product [Moneuplotes crassus]|uniref:Uncharacterized protein n=1 Tax=Euplotes crassus TaxID=5936 RepID=A0AAD1XRL2_EUPCR|nr:unnamed protein product [Moneuplotes crassus]
MVDYGFLDLIFSPSSINSIVISVLWFSFESALDIPPEGLVMMLNKMSFHQIVTSNIIHKSTSWQPLKLTLVLLFVFVTKLSEFNFFVGLNDCSSTFEHLTVWRCCWRYVGCFESGLHLAFLEVFALLLPAISSGVVAAGDFVFKPADALLHCPEFMFALQNAFIDFASEHECCVEADENTEADFEEFENTTKNSSDFEEVEDSSAILANQTVLRNV